MFPEPRFIAVNGIRMAVHEAGAGAPVILLHGFPELAFSWRHQLPALANAGFRVVAPDMRGYGRTDVPANVSDYGIDRLIDDILGLLDALDTQSANFVGHDWGAILLWHFAMRHPDRIERLVNLNIPHYPEPPDDPIDAFRARFGDDFYIVNFQDTAEADQVFARDPRHFINMMMRKNQLSREQFEKAPAARRSISLLATAKRDAGSGDPLLDETELDYYAAAFSRTGFTGAINWYRNWSDNWRRFHGVARTIDVPTLFIGADNDLVVQPEHIEAMRPLFTSELRIEMLDSCGHWSQQEQPQQVNRLIVTWLVNGR